VFILKIPKIYLEQETTMTE